jgi:hypothetical protein
MREVHARCVKISHTSSLQGKYSCVFIEISAKMRLAPVVLKNFLEIRLTGGVIQVKFANCPGRKNKN